MSGNYKIKMKRKFFLVSTLFFLTLNISKPQTLKLGFAAEPSFVLYKNINKDRVSFIPYSLNLKIITAPFNWLNLEARPGLFYGGEDFSWIELGLYTRLNILPTKFYFIAGINDHIRGGYDDILYNGFGIGYQKDSLAAFDIIFYWKSFVNNEKINGLIKLSISFAWDIL